MTEIFIDPSKTNISFDVIPKSLHVVGFEIVIIDTDKNTVLERYNNAVEKNSVNVRLNNPTSYYKGKYLSSVFTIKSTDGTDSDYRFVFSVALNGIDITPQITITGTTDGGVDHRMPTFHMN